MEAFEPTAGAITSSKLTTAGPADGAEASLAAARPAEGGAATDVVCRILDVLLSAVLLLLLMPLLVAIAIAVRIDSPGPVLFRQRRLGLQLRPFTVNKFRTMRNGVDDECHRKFVLSLMAGYDPAPPRSGPRFKLTDDDRVTRLGAMLRRTSLDELPQLWNVLRGEMSMVGPRPPIPYEVEQYPSAWFGRFRVKPGITGLWQVRGRCELTYADMVRLDREYIERRSLWLNLWIVLRTVPVVLSTRGAR